MRRLSKNQQLVMDAYNADPGCVNEEHRLLEFVWSQQGWDNTKSLYWNLQRVSHPESLSRARRLLHEKGLITYSDEATERRMGYYKEALDEYGQPYMVFVNE